jgi:hypothetical protein
MITLENDNIQAFKNDNVLSFLSYHFPLYIFCVIIYVIIYCYQVPPFFFFLKHFTIKNDNIQALKNYNIYSMKKDNIQILKNDNIYTMKN